jgi:hypothetical protein
MSAYPSDLAASEHLRAHGYTVLPPKKGRRFRCLRCGHEWTARVPNPKFCPRDHTVRYEEIP